jgi:hypothetical protein
MAIERQKEPGEKFMERVAGYMNDGQMNVDLMIHDLIAALKGGGFDEFALHERVAHVWPTIEVAIGKVN